MSGIVGFTRFEKKTAKEESQKILSKMMDKISRRGSDEDGFYMNDHCFFGHKRLISLDAEGGKQPMTFYYEGANYTIVYDGHIYNMEEIKKDLIDAGFSIETHSDVEILLKAFIHFNYGVVHKLNGVFAFCIWNDQKQELFVARDHFGIKPLYYTVQENTFIFASEVKSILEFPGIDAKIDSIGICELFGLGPCHTPGNGIFKNIFEIEPAHFGIFNREGLHLEKYWKLESKMHTDDFTTTCDNIKFLIEDSIHNQLHADIPACTFLSGGLDSSIISYYAAKYRKEKGLSPLLTYSVDYIDNDINFQKTDFQPNSDKYYIDIMTKKLDSIHKNIVLDTPELINNLENAMIARDFPGMADVDSSLLLFCKNVKEEASISLTGECADEIFGGYPWFFREDALNSNTFPWSLAILERQKLLNPSIAKQINLKEYVDDKYLKTLSEVEILDTDSNETAEKRKISYLTMKWFMQTLLDRSDRMAMHSGFDIRVPFCDYRLAEYVWNIPWDMKALNGREKGLLRYAMKDILPSEIIDRKKSPYPKTWNPNYLKQVKDILTNILENSNSPIHDLLDTNYIKEIIETDGKAFTRPWFGQLMTGPQLMAYLIQVNMWLEKYQPKIEL